MKNLTAFFYITWILITFCLTSCGQSGDLYLPDSTTQTKQAQK